MRATSKHAENLHVREEWEDIETLFFLYFILKLFCACPRKQYHITYRVHVFDVHLCMGGVCVYGVDACGTSIQNQLK